MLRYQRFLGFFALILVSTTWLTASAIAATVADVSVPDTATVGGQDLVLNGAGVREATLLKVKVYVMGLYLPAKSQDADAIIRSDGNKRITMHFVRDVGAKDLRKGWTEGFEKNYPDVKMIQGEIDKFNASMRDVKEGEVITLDFADQSLDVSIGGQQIDSIEGKSFQEAVLAIWLGSKPPNNSLKSGVLGASP
jgi:hypothetical protein